MNTSNMQVLMRMLLGEYFSAHVAPLFTYSNHSSLRHEKDPYLGLVDCVKKVAAEEGWQSLYRVWWLTALAGVGNALA